MNPGCGVKLALVRRCGWLWDRGFQKESPQQPGKFGSRRVTGNWKALEGYTIQQQPSSVGTELPTYEQQDSRRWHQTGFIRGLRAIQGCLRFSTGRHSCLLKRSLDSGHYPQILCMQFANDPTMDSIKAGSICAFAVLAAWLTVPSCVRIRPNPVSNFLPLPGAGNVCSSCSCETLTYSVFKVMDSIPEYRVHGPLCLVLWRSSMCSE